MVAIRYRVRAEELRAQGGALMPVTTKAKMEFVYAMARHSKATLHDCQRLMRYAATLQRIAEAHCNDSKCPYGPHLPDGGCMKQESIQWKVGEICERIDGVLDAIFSNDPRGAVVKLKVADGYTNDMGREGICVPA
jgi:hypothetical protein